MKIQQRHGPLLLLFLPSLVLSSPASGSKSSQTNLVVDIDTLSDDSLVSDSTISSNSKARVDVGTKVAPVDGKDGMPHEGPFISLSDKGRRKGDSADANQDLDSDSRDLPTLKNRPVDPTIIDGKKIPESNDGVMDDPHRKPPKRGTTGTGGGVSEKDKARKAKEGRTGEKVEMVPETPKEKPPLPHSEQEKMLGDIETKAEKDKSKSEKVTDDIAGLEKPADLPGKVYDHPNPLPNSANKDHLDVSSPSKSGNKLPAGEGEANEGIIQPLHSFVLSLAMILVSEIGDKTFLVAALMAMKHDRMVVFTAAFGALLVMTVLSAVLGHTLPALIPKRLTSFLASGLFFVFGAKLLREGMAMDPNEGVAAEMHEVEMELEEKEHQASKQGRRSSVSPYALEMGLARDRKPRPQSRFPSPPRSPSMSPVRSPSPRGGLVNEVTVGLSNLLSLLLSPAWVQTFIMTFLGEWGDRSQIATIAMAAGQDYWWVTLGAMLGHACCTGVAVIGGRAIAGKVSLKFVTVGGAVAFIVFGFVYLVEALYA
ncbi:putative upf0016 domain-containing protein [Rosellinia necatrix]|uniref:Putative upf0016 domain-containing protein n=1 Tax=Rosellinia necatrix TaxID=77044 RepID=A0A1W2TS66_ROSNE|nr:putative upf0016 domain-containing protein [Rosellinia necatrix]